MNFKVSAQQGFSLLEILIAFSILALSLGILLNIFSGGLRRTIISEEYQQAVVIAESKLAAAGVETELDEGLTQGDVQDKFFWQVQVQAYNLEEAGLEAESVTVFPYHVMATVEWAAGDNNRQVVLRTLKLAGVDPNESL